MSARKAKADIASSGIAGAADAASTAAVEAQHDDDTDSVHYDSDSSTDDGDGDNSATGSDLHLNKSLNSGLNTGASSIDNTSIGTYRRAHSSPSSASTDHRDDDHSLGDASAATAVYTSLNGLVPSEKLPDMCIRCGEVEFPAHRAVVCSQSRFFGRIMTGGQSANAANTAKEAVTGVVNVSEEDNPVVVERMLQFLYTSNYDDNVVLHAGSPVTETLLSTDTTSCDLRSVTDVEDDILPGQRAVGHEEEAAAKIFVPEGWWQEYGAQETSDEDERRVSDAELGPGTAPKPKPKPNSKSKSKRNRYAPPFGPVGPGDATVALRELRAKLQLARGSEMILHARVCMAADKYGIPTLRLVARDRFHRTAQNWWRRCNAFPAIIDEIFSSTPPGELALREIVCRLVGDAVAAESLPFTAAATAAAAAAAATHDWTHILKAISVPVTVPVPGMIVPELLPGHVKRLAKTPAEMVAASTANATNGTYGTNATNATNATNGADATDAAGRMSVMVWMDPIMRKHGEFAIGVMKYMMASTTRSQTWY